MRQALWVRPDALRKAGVVGICVKDDGPCERDAKTIITPETKMLVVSVAHEFWGRKRAPVTFRIWLVPPRASVR
jgi:hypothetical protein